MPFRIVSFGAINVPFGLMSFGIVSFDVMSFGVMSFGVMSFGHCPCIGLQVAGCSLYLGKDHHELGDELYEGSG